MNWRAAHLRARFRARNIWLLLAAIIACGAGILYWNDDTVFQLALYVLGCAGSMILGAGLFLLGAISPRP